jgi:hypothetical protein
MNSTLLAKLIYIPLLQTGQKFNEFYSPLIDDWYQDFIETGLSYYTRRLLNSYYYKETICKTYVGCNLSPLALGFEHLILSDWVKWIEGDADRLEEIIDRLFKFYTEDLGVLDRWKTEKGLPKDPEEALDWFLTYHHERK